MNNPNTSPFDFDKWAKLAREDPVAFERKRKLLIEQEISRAPASRQPHLRAMQWRIEMERRKYKDKLSYCAHIFNRMWDSVYGPNGLLDALQTITTDKGLSHRIRHSSAQVLPLHRGRGRSTCPPLAPHKKQ